MDAGEDLLAQAVVAQFLTQFHESSEDLWPGMEKKDSFYFEQVAEEHRKDFLQEPRPRPPQEKGLFRSLPRMKWIG